MANSVLTNHLREYLQGDEELEGNQERSARGDIRERTKAGITDLALIFEELEENDRKNLTDFYPEPIDGEPIGDAPFEYGSFQGALTRVIAFALQCADDMGMSASQILEYALQHYLQHRQEIDSANVKVDIQIDPVEYTNDFEQDADGDLPDYPGPVVGFFRESFSDDSEIQFDAPGNSVSVGQAEEQSRD
jgi:hypothetical protein